MMADGYFIWFCLNNANLYIGYLNTLYSESATKMVELIPGSEFYVTENQKTSILVQGDARGCIGITVIYILFGLCYTLGSCFAFNIRRPHHNWKKDMLPYFFV